LGYVARNGDVDEGYEAHVLIAESAEEMWIDEGERWEWLGRGHGVVVEGINVTAAAGVGEWMLEWPDDCGPVVFRECGIVLKAEEEEDCYNRRDCLFE
jgi:hypothetical protein